MKKFPNDNQEVFLQDLMGSPSTNNETQNDGLDPTILEDLERDNEEG